MNTNQIQLERSLQNLVNNQDSMVRSFFYQSFTVPQAGFTPLAGTMANYYSNAQGDNFSSAAGDAQALLAAVNALVAEKKSLEKSLDSVIENLNIRNRELNEWIFERDVRCNTMAQKSISSCKANANTRIKDIQESIDHYTRLQKSIASQIAEKQKAIDAAQKAYSVESNKTPEQKQQDQLVQAQAAATVTRAQSRAGNLKILAISAGTLLLLGGITMLVLRKTT